MKRLLGSLVLILLLGGALMAYAAEWVGCKYLTAGTGITITCPDTVGRGGATITGSGGTPGGSSGQFQYNDGAGAFAGAAELVRNTIDLAGTTIQVGGLTPKNVNAIQGGVSIIGSGAQAFYGVAIEQADASSPVLAFTGYRGTNATPAATGSGDFIGYITGQGYDGAAFKEGANIVFDTAGAWSAGSTPGRIIMSTRAIGAGSAAERLRIDNTGLTTITGTLNVTTAYQANTAPGVSATKTVRDAAGTGTCTLIFTFGLLTGGTC